MTEPVHVQLLSDLHADVAPIAPVRLAPGADIVVVAGDTCEGCENPHGYGTENGAYDPALVLEFAR